jgi:hypothetical protein
VISPAKHVHVAANHSRPTGSSLTDDSTLVSISTDSLAAGRQFSDEVSLPTSAERPPLLIRFVYNIGNIANARVSGVA